MQDFTYKAGAAWIDFGRGKLSTTPARVDAIGCKRGLVLSTLQQKDLAKRVADLLGPACVGIFDGAAMHTPVDVTEDAIFVFRKLDADCVVSVGGGSTTGLGKAIAYRADVPNIAIPTTYAGSEVTPILGQTENGIKTTLSDSKVLPTAVIYDPNLTDGLPQQMSVVSGLNAMAHAAEALYAKDRNPISTMLATQGLAALHDGLPCIAADPQSKSGRDAALYGAWLCGTVLGQVGMALHHKICHTLGGSFDMPHAETHAVMLPHTIGFNAASVSEATRPLADLLQADPGTGLFEFAKSIGSPLSLRELGFQQADLDRAAEIATRNPYWNPRSFDQAAIRHLLQNAFDGSPPH